MKIAIIGYGFVGKAVHYGFKNSGNEIFIVDPLHFPENAISDLEIFRPDFTFVCVPTPMGNDGKINSDIITEVVTDLQNSPSGTVIIKSTVTPDIVTKLTKYKRFVYNPEFLTERNALHEFVNPKFHILGGHPEFTKKVKNLYRFNSNCNPAPYLYMTPSEASFVKYGINSFLAMKVVWFNQYKDLIEESGCRYNVISNAIGSDDRIGYSHTIVPGFDGKKGFGGSCFPKDTSALLEYSKDRSLLDILETVIHVNNGYRVNYELDDREKEQNISYV